MKVEQIPQAHLLKEYWLPVLNNARVVGVVHFITKYLYLRESIQDSD